MTTAQPPLLERLVGDIDAFAAEHWGTRPMLRHTSERFTDLLSVEDVEDCLDGALRQPAFRLVRDGETLPTEAVTKTLRLGGRDIDRVADPERIAAEFASGASIVLQGLDRFWPNAIEMAKTLEAELGHPIQLNAYLSPADAKALAEHTD
ncbi:MAG TPA: hypothetical protein VMS14_09400, partial [Ilumatobacteraceae bacterium]|nr:hypothetical protein [Ilumatobacteraceae bacterium]